MTESILLSGDDFNAGSCDIPDHSGLEVRLDLDWVAVLVFSRTNVEHGEDARDGNPQGCVCHEAARTDATARGHQLVT